MAPAYTPVSTDEEAATQNSQKRAPTWLKALWIMQGLFSFMEILGVPLVITFLFMQASSLVLVIGLIIQAFDTWASAWIIVKVRQQLSAPRTKALRTEGYKAAIATWWIVRIPFDSSAKLIKPVGYEQYSQQEKDMYEEFMSNMWIVKVFLMVFLVVAFYIPLWAAWRDRKADEQGGKSGEVELEDQQVGLLRGQSSDGPDDFVEQDTADDKRKARG